MADTDKIKIEFERSQVTEDILKGWEKVSGQEQGFDSAEVLAHYLGAMEDFAQHLSALMIAEALFKAAVSACADCKAKDGGLCQEHDAIYDKTYPQLIPKLLNVGVNIGLWSIYTSARAEKGLKVVREPGRVSVSGLSQLFEQLGKE